MVVTRDREGGDGKLLLTRYRSHSCRMEGYIRLMPYSTVLTGNNTVLCT